ncbi:hypothetical protein IV102_13335 [bacterium]|nr:hypothetical protein [bacterium]
MSRHAMQELPGPNWLMDPCPGAFAALTGAGDAKASLTDKLRMRWPGFEANLNQDVPRSTNDLWRQTGGNVHADPNSMQGTSAAYWGALPEMVREHLLDPNLHVAPSQCAQKTPG